MDKRVTVDLPEEVYKELIKIQLQSFLTSDKKRSLNEIIREAVIEYVEKQKAAQ